MERFEKDLEVKGMETNLTKMAHGNWVCGRI